MRAIWVIIGGIAGFVVGLVALDVVAYLVIGAPSFSDIKNRQAIASAAQLGPLGGLLGLGLGIWLALRLARRAP
jgi:hypothetical protein